LAALELRHSPFECLRDLLDYLAKQIQLPNRNRRKNVVARTTFDEKVRDRQRIIVPRLTIHAGSADRLKLMHVAETVHVASGIEQRADTLYILAGCGPMQRVGIVTGFARIRIGAASQE